MNNLLNVYNNILSYTLTAILLLFVFHNIDTLSSIDVDIAHHYALIRRIYDEYTLGSIVDSSLGEMAGYPRGSHYLAVIVGTLVNSCFLGMQIISIFSIATIWLSIVLILSMTAEGKSKIILSIFSIIIVQSWSRKFEQLDEWIFCLKSATILPVIRRRDDQEIAT